MIKFEITGSVVLLLGCAVALTAQVDEHVGLERPEAWAMQYFTAVGLMQGSAPPPGLEKGQFALGFDIANIPHLSKGERTVGFNGTKEENLNKAPLLARPLIHYGITDRLAVTASYVPPIEIFDRLKTQLAGIAFTYKVMERGRWGLNLRAYGQWSEAEGDFTCSEEIAGSDDPHINPFDCIEPSSDVFTGLSGTLEVVVDYRFKTTRPIDAFASIAWTYADMEFDVDALWAGGFADQRTLYADGGMWSFALGLRGEITDRWHASLGVIHVPLDVKRPPDYRTENDSLTHVRFALNLLL